MTTLLSKFDLNTPRVLSKFESKVYKVTQQIPKGSVTSYKLIAIAIGEPNCSRQVGRALSMNPFAPEVPCFRVIYSDRRIGGFFGTKDVTSDNVKSKIALLESEGVKFYRGKLEKSQKFFVPSPLEEES